MATDARRHGSQGRVTVERFERSPVANTLASRFLVIQSQVVELKTELELNQK